MPTHAEVDLVVFDVLGTLVDEPGGLRDSIRELAPAGDAGRVDDLVEMWQSHVAEMQREMLEGRRPYADSDILDREAAGLVASRCGVTDAAAVDRLATAERRLDPRPDTVEASNDSRGVTLSSVCPREPSDADPAQRPCWTAMALPALGGGRSELQTRP